MAITNANEKELWERIQAYKFDADPNVPISFLDKLCKETQWGKTFAKEAIEEYKKFVFLCCVLPKGASPSGIVDQVWHLHLTYTKTYWDDFCKNVLRRPLHHYPSDGTSEKSRSLNDKYIETLWAYQRYFDQLPLSGFWQSYILKENLDVNPKYSIIYTLIMVVMALILPFYIEGEMIAFNLNGKNFLIYYAILFACGIGLYVFEFLQFRQVQIQFVKKNIVKIPNPYQIAYYLYGSHHAIQTCLLNLIENDLLKIDFQNKYGIVINNINTTRSLSVNVASNPFYKKILNQDFKMTYFYEEIRRNWFNSTDFEHLELDAVKRNLKGNSIPYPLISLLILGILRVFQGIFNDKPVNYLLIEIGVGIIIFLILTNYFINHKSDFKNGIKSKYLDPNRDNESAELFSIKGRAALDDFESGSFLKNIFPRYSKTGGKKDKTCSSCTSTCSSGSCGSSGGDGGGGDGGGCGGCGGGGD